MFPCPSGEDRTSIHEEKLKHQQENQNLNHQKIIEKEQNQECHVEVEIVNGEAELGKLQHSNVLTTARPKIISNSTQPDESVIVNVENLTNKLVSVPLTDNNNKPTVINATSAIVDVVTKDPLTEDTEESIPFYSTTRVLVKNLLVVMLISSILVALVGLSWLYMGPAIAGLLVAVAGITYLLSSGLYRWFYVAYKTLPRDLM